MDARLLIGKLPSPHTCDTGCHDSEHHGTAAELDPRHHEPRLPLVSTSMSAGIRGSDIPTETSWQKHVVRIMNVTQH